jgi:uncharacterized protein YqjF (DUF2071 family)
MGTYLTDVGQAFQPDLAALGSRRIGQPGKADLHERGAVSRPWVWSQHWRDVLFLHWQVPVGRLRRHVPAPLEIDTWEERAWVSLVLFRLRVRPRWLPFLPGLSNLVEANLRTYVHFHGRPAIWFLSVHADNAWAIRLAKWLTPMPYLQADMTYRGQDDQFRFSARRTSFPSCRLSLAFRPDPAGEETPDGTLDAWLLERYRLYIQDCRNKLLEAEVVHPPWIVHKANLSMSDNTLGEPLGLDLSRAPDRVHYSAGVQARFGGFRGVNGVE